MILGGCVHRLIYFLIGTACVARVSSFTGPWPAKERVVDCEAKRMSKPTFLLGAVLMLTAYQLQYNSKTKPNVDKEIFSLAVTTFKITLRSRKSCVLRVWGTCKVVSHCELDS